MFLVAHDSHPEFNSFEKYDSLFDDLSVNDENCSLNVHSNDIFGTDQLCNFSSFPPTSVILKQDLKDVNYELKICGILESGARTRTEIQVKMILILTAWIRCADGKTVPLNSPFHYLQLPTGPFHGSSNSSSAATSANPLKSLYVSKRASNEKLYLHAKLVLSQQSVDEPGLEACAACQMRERKRQERRRAMLKNGGGGSEQDLVPLLESVPIIIFSSVSSILEFSGSGEVMVPIRLTCYNRHHEDRDGFRLVVSLYNELGTLVAQQISPPIVVTDDHKRSPSIAKKAMIYEDGSAGAIISRKESYEPPTKRIWVDYQTSVSAASMSSSSAAIEYLPSSPTPASRYLVPANEQSAHIFKIIPAEGPLFGGTEITVIGQGFSAQTLVFFGLIQAPPILYLGPNTLVVRLPPSITSGFVHVTTARTKIAADGRSVAIPHETKEPMSPVLIHYKNDLDRAMMELALQLIGMKMTGRVDDARDIAMRIIQENAPASGTGKPQPSTHEQQLEHALITFFTSIEINMQVDFTAKDFCRVRTSSGQTLLHLAGIRGYERLFEYIASFDGTGGVYGSSVSEATDESGFVAADFSYMAGMYGLLQRIGLDESYMEEDDILQEIGEKDYYARRYARVLEGVRERQVIVGKISRAGAYIRVLLREPTRLRGFFQRLRTSIWRRLGSSKTVKPYYYHQLLFVPQSHPTVAARGAQRTQSSSSASSSLSNLGSFCKKFFVNLVSSFKRFNRDFPLSQKLGSRGVVFYYIWLPLILVAFAVWILGFIWKDSACSTRPSPSTVEQSQNSNTVVAERS